MLEARPHLHKQRVRPGEAHGAGCQHAGSCLRLRPAGLAQGALGMRQTVAHLRRP